MPQQMVGDNPDKEKIVAEFQSRLHDSLNIKNLKQYVKAFQKCVWSYLMSYDETIISNLIFSAVKTCV